LKDRANRLLGAGSVLATAAATLCRLVAGGTGRSANGAVARHLSLRDDTRFSGTAVGGVEAEFIGTTTKLVVETGSFTALPIAAESRRTAVVVGSAIVAITPAANTFGATSPATLI